MKQKLQLEKINNLLVIVPHQDDEVLMAGGLIHQLLQQERRVSVCIVTNGDYGSTDFSKGQTRLRESLAGLSVLGLSSEAVYFFGYADTGMAPEESFLTRLYFSDDAVQNFPSGCTCHTYGLPEKPDFHSQFFQERGSYCKASLQQDLRELLAWIQPDTVLTTHKADRHGDHEALYYFVKDALQNLDPSVRPRLFVGLVHSPEGDESWPERNTSFFTEPKGIADFGLNWKNRLVLSLPAELSGGQTPSNLKFQALGKYETALEPNAIDYLLSFVKDEEIFWEIQEI